MAYEGLFSRNRPPNKLDGFYHEWSRYVTTVCLPLHYAKKVTILFLGDIHPRLLTRLVQSFIDQDPNGTFGNPAAWGDLALQLEGDINGEVVRLGGEMKEAHERFLRRFSEKWVSSFRTHNGTVLMETAASVTTEEDGAVMEQLVRIFRQANQLRKDTINSIVGVSFLGRPMIIGQADST